MLISQCLAPVGDFLELVVEIKGLLVEEGEDLRHEDASDPLPLVDPVVAVRQARPGQASDRAPGRRHRVVDHEAETPPLLDPGVERLSQSNDRGRGLGK